jgi:hypothetical protein
MDYLVWLQLLIVVAICADRAGHICRPLTYTFSIKARKTAIACFFCVFLPFLLMTVPYIVCAEKTLEYFRDFFTDGLDNEEAWNAVKDNSFKCKGFADNDGKITDSYVFLSE